MTLIEIINRRQNRFRKERCSEWWEGYKSGWYWAYEDLKEILEQNGFDMDIVVIKERVGIDDK